MNLDLDGRVVVITGGNSGIGLATVRTLRREGAKVVAGDLGTDELRRETGEDVHAVEIDLSVPTGPPQLAAVARDVHGRIDVLVNNVGRAINRASFLEVTDDDWQASLNLNLLAMARMSRAVLPTMLERGKGVIVSVASDAARQPEPFFVD